MRSTATFKSWKLALLLSFLVVAHLHLPPSLGQMMARGTSLLPSFHAVVGQFVAFIEAFASIASVSAHGDDDNGTGDDGSQEVVAGEVIVEVESGANPTEVAQRHRLTILERLDDSDIFRMGFPSGQTLEGVLEELKNDPDVEEAEPHFLADLPEVDPKIDPRTIFFIDPRSFAFIDGSSPGEYFDQAAMQRVRTDEAHSLARGQGVMVAVIDTGIDRNHPVFDGGRRISPDGYNFIDNNNDSSESCPQNPQDAPGCGHGTFIAGIISLVAPEAKILPLRAFDAQGKGKAFDIAQAINYAVQRGATILNMSFGLHERSFVLGLALQAAYRKGVLLVTSAGNQGVDLRKHPQYPAVEVGPVDRVIAVAATDAQDVKADFSNYGSPIDVSAPGVGIYSAYPDGRFGTWSGTSFSAPFVAGEAALLYSITSQPDQLGYATRQDVMQAIYDSAVNIDANNPDMVGNLGRGRIDVLGAINNMHR